MAKKRKAKRGYRSPGSRPGGGGGGGDMMAQMQQMQQLQEQMLAAQDALKEETVSVSVGGGVITVVATGQQEIQDITIAPEVVDPEDVEMLQDLVLAAVNEALDQSREMANQAMGGLTDRIDLPPGLL